MTRMHSSRIHTAHFSGCLGGAPRADTPAPCGYTDTCENITFPQLLLRAVNTGTFFLVFYHVDFCPQALRTWTRRMKTKYGETGRANSTSFFRVSVTQWVSATFGASLTNATKMAEVSIFH